MADLRCVCHNLSLAALLSHARRHGVSTFAELSQRTGCGSNCGSCRPYIERMLATGVVPQTDDVKSYTDISQLVFDDDEPE